MQIKDAIVINAPLERVFAVFSNLDTITQALKSITKIEQIAGPAQMVVGTKWKETRTVFGKEASETMWVTAITPNSSYVVEADSNGMHYMTEYKFMPEANGTRVEMTFSGTAKSWLTKVMGMIMGVLFAGATKKALHQDLVELKEFCEEGLDSRS